MNLIASATLDWGIGYQNGLLFRVSADMVQFRKKTTGGVVVMGRNTFLSMPNRQPLPNRVNIVLSRDLGFAPDGATVVRSVDELLRLLRDYDDERVFVIGGGAVYRALLPYCGKAYITRFYAAKPADTFLPDLDASPDWRLAKRSVLHEQDGLYYTFDLYEKER
ncbi:MAG: dihydrofolate reductase [Clostridia bacterium]|nr:dihydrofolate reductase [Clostridia bacterium]